MAANKDSIITLKDFSNSVESGLSDFKQVAVTIGLVFLANMAANLELGSWLGLGLADLLPPLDFFVEVRVMQVFNLFGLQDVVQGHPVVRVLRLERKNGTA